MREKPILFSGPVVRAILDGTKSQTRRVVNPQPKPCDHKPWPGDYKPNWVFDADGWHCAQCGNGMHMDRRSASGVSGFRCPYGQPKEKLWVRETFCDDWQDTRGIVYRADGGLDGEMADAGCKWRPSIFMPRAASRITLEVTGVRVERLQDISEADAQAEGCERLYDEDPGFIYRDGDNPDWKVCPKCGGTRLHNALGQNLGVIFDVDCRECDTYVKRYRHLWEAINGPGSWDANPWVWVVEFRKLG